MNFVLKNKYLILVFILISIFSPFPVFAQVNNTICSPLGYTVLTINGMYTDLKRAIENRDKLQSKLSNTYNNEKITIDYLLNPSHIVGLGDIFAVAYQKLFENENISDYDLIEIINDASQKVKTQKLLLVGHSQGNFYANSLYNAITGINKVPSRSVGVYGVATPSSYVAGIGGKYITSTTDEVMNKVRWKNILNVLPANTNIKLSASDGNGHSFSDVYLKYEGGRIVSELNSSLERLSSTVIQDENKPCIFPPKLTIVHKVEGEILAVVDPVANVTKNVSINTAVGLYKIGNITAQTYLAFINNAGKILADAFGGIASRNGAAVVLSGDPDPISSPDVLDNSPSNPQESTQQDPKPIIKTPVPKNVTATIPFPTPKKTEAKEALSVAPVMLTQSENKNINKNIVTKTEEKISITTNLQDLYANVLPSGGAIASLDITPPTPPLPPVPPAPPAPDTTPPVVSILGSNPVTITVGDVYTEAGATALDDIDGTLSTITTGSANTAVVGTYTIAYTATDSAGNIGTATRTVNVNAIVPSPSTHVSGVMVVDDTWTKANSPYLVSGEFIIDPNRTLTIEPGVVVKFQDQASRLVLNNGTLKADGTPAERIYFTSFKDDSVGGDTNGDGSATSPAPGDWKNIFISTPSVSNFFSNIVVRYAGASGAAAIDYYFNNTQVLSIIDSVISDNADKGISQKFGTVNVSHSEIARNKYGLYSDSGNLSISNNNIHDNTLYGAYNLQTLPYSWGSNYWGDPSGPYNSVSNPGGLGNAVSDNAIALPWLSTNPL